MPKRAEKRKSNRKHTCDVCGETIGAHTMYYVLDEFERDGVKRTKSCVTCEEGGIRKVQVARSFKWCRLCGGKIKRNTTHVKVGEPGKGRTTYLCMPCSERI